MILLGEHDANIISLNMNSKYLGISLFTTNFVFLPLLLKKRRNR